MLQFDLLSGTPEEQLKKEEEAKAKAKKEKEEREKKMKEMEEARKKSGNTAPAPKKKEKPFEGKRIVKVYGNVVFEEEDPKVKDETIRKKLQADYGFGELQKDITHFKLVKESDELAYLLVGPSFQKKG